MADPIEKAGGSRWTANSGEFAGDVKVFHLKRWSRLPDKAKVATLRRFAEEYGADPKMRWFTAGVLNKMGVAPRDFPATAAALLKFVQTEVYYTNESGEQLQSPWRTLQVKNGDCFAAGTLLLRDDYELVAVEDIKVGERIWGRNAWTTVTDWAYKGNKYVSKIKVTEGEFTVTGDHKVYVVDASDLETTTRIHVSDLKVGMILLTPSWTPLLDEDVDGKLRALTGTYLGMGTGRPHYCGGDGPPVIAGQVLAIDEGCAVEPVYDITTSDHYVYLPEARCTVSNCDDMSGLLASMAESIALPWRFALGGYRTLPGGKKKRVRWIEGQPWPKGHVQFVHIYVMLGWPPFGAAVWKSAEPTVRGLPLGHDVVLHGIPAGANGGRDLGGWFGPSSYGASQLFTGEASADFKIVEGNSLPANVINAIDYSGLLNSVVQGVITAVAIGYVGNKLGKKGGM